MSLNAKARGQDWAEQELVLLPMMTSMRLWNEIRWPTYKGRRLSMLVNPLFCNVKASVEATWFVELRLNAFPATSRI